MSMSVQEQSSSFKSTTSKSVQVIQSGGNTITNNSSSGVGEIYVPACDGTSSTVQKSQQQEMSSKSSTTNKSANESNNMNSRREQDLLSSSSTSSINSDSTLRDIARFDDFVFRPTFMNFDSMFGTGSEFEDVSRDVYHVNDGQTFEMKLEVQEYKPEEIQVKISDNLVTVSAKQEQRSENNFRSRQFSKKFNIPQGVKPESITCNLTAQGVLKISAPIEKQTTTNNSGGAITSNNTSRQESVSSTTSTAANKAQHKQVSKTQQQESVTSSRKSSINSDISSIRDMSSFDDEFTLRPRRIDFDALISKARQDSVDFQDISKEVSNTNDGKKFEMKLEVKDFKVEEVEVKITKNLIKIEGKHESEFASRSFYKEFTIPHGVKANTIQCSMNDENGILTISAPIQQQQAINSAINSSVNKTATRTEQEVTSSVKQQQQVQQQQQINATQKQQQQQTVHSDSASSINSNTSSLRDTSASRRLEDFILRPIMDFDSLIANRDSHFEDISKEICHTNDGKKFEMKLHVPDFKPEELQIKISNNMVTVEGKQESSCSSRTFYKKFSIPQGVTPETITSSLSTTGTLTIQAPINSQLIRGDNIGVSKITQQQTTTSTSINSGNIVKQEIQNQQTQQQQQQQLHSSDINTSSLATNNINTSLDAFSNKFGQDFILRPIMDLDALMAKDTRFEDISKEICQQNDGKKFETKLDVPDFKPEELEVKISNNMVTITGKQESRQENNFSSRSFYKKFSIPQGVKPENITSSLSPKGVLTIQAPIEESLANQQQSITSNTTSVTQQTQQEATRQMNINQTQQQTSQISQQQLHQQQQQQQRLEKSVLSDSTSSVNSNASSINQKIASNRLMDQDFILRPIMNLNSLMSLDSTFEDVSKEISHANDGNKFEMKLDVPDFKPEELEVKISNNMVSIQGKQESRQENNFSSRSFCKKFSIPQGVKPENITSRLSSKGVLTLTAPIEKSQSQICSANTNSISRQEQVEQQQRQEASSTTSISSKNVSSNVTSSIQNNKGITSSNNISILRPKMNLDNLATIQSSNFEDISKELCHVIDGKNFEMKLEVQQFRPEEIEVKISNNMVTIEGKQEMREENNFRSREFCKKFSIPQGVKPENISCSLNDNGTLTISAPVEKSTPALALTERTSSVESSQSQEQSGHTHSSKKVSSTVSSTSSTVQSSTSQF